METNYSYFNHIELNYGRQVVVVMKKLMNCSRSRASLTSHTHLLEMCNKHRILPPSLNFNLNFFNIYGSIGHKLYDRIRWIVFKERISQSHREIKRLLNLQNDLVRELRDQLASEVFVNFMQNLTDLFDYIFYDTQAICAEKYQRWFVQAFQKYRRTRVTDPKWIKNLTDTDIPPNVLSVLSLGNRFAPRSHVEGKSIVDVVARVISSSDHLPAPTRTEVRNKSSNILTNHLKVPKTKSIEEIFMEKDLEESKNFLEENPDLFVGTADKGSVTVIAHRDDYVQKMTQQFDDPHTYEKVHLTRRNHNPVALSQKKVNSWLSEMEKFQFLEPRLASNLRKYNSSLPNAYGLFKIHKEGNPVRVIIPSYNAATYPLSKYYCRVLSSVLGKGPTHIKNGMDFRDKIKNLKLPRNYRLASVDVVSMFTNMPRELIIDVIKERWRDISPHTSLPLERFIEGMNLIFDNCFHSFNGQVYRQIDGTPMGLPLSPAICELVMEFIDRYILERCRHLQINVLYYGRYVDDGFLVASGRSFPRILQIFNSIHPRLRFTMEDENDGTLPFLDLKVVRNEDGNIITDWYHKPTWSGRYLNFQSYLPLSYKRNTVSVLTRKVLELSDESFHQKNFDVIRNTLYLNSYPTDFVNKIIEQTIVKFNMLGPMNQPNSPQKYLSIPYDAVVFNKLRVLFQPYNIQVIAKPHNTLGQLLFSKNKDRTPREFTTNVVYSIECTCNELYIGNTSQWALTRFKQHQSRNSEHSALSAHLIESGHQISFDKMKFIANEPHRRIREIKEMAYIKSSANINNQIDCVPLGSIFDNVLKQCITL